MPLRLLLAPALFLLCLHACSILDPEGPVEVRVENASSFVLAEGLLYLPGDSLFFLDLQPSQANPYKEVARAYRIATVQVVAGQDTSRLQVIDFVGEKPLGPGRYTYVLSFFDNLLPSLVLELRKDQ